MRNLELLHSVRVGDAAELTGARAVCVDIDTRTVYCATPTGLCGLDTTTQQVSHQVSLVEGGFLSPDGSEHIVSVEHLPDQMSVCAATSRGDVLLWNTGTDEVECVGSVENGIMAMSWSTDQELVVLATGQSTLIIMTREFDPVTEVPIYSDTQAEAQFVNVGWGKKETQFHGSEGKQAAFTKIETVVPATEMDDKLPRICWHGDGQHFVVSAINPNTGSRRLSVWTRECILHSTSEGVSGQEQALGWKSNLNLLTSVQRTETSLDVIFFEKNGLRHREFSLPFEVNKVKVLELLYNSDATVLAVWLEDCHSDSTESEPRSYVQLWCMGNYHWYLKQTLAFCVGSELGAVCWDPESPLCVHAVTTAGHYLQYTWTWTTHHSTGTSSDDTRTVAVIDGSGVLMTPFRQMIVPPPLSAYSLQLPSAVNHIMFAPPPALSDPSIPDNPNDLAVLLCDGRVAFVSFEDGKICKHDDSLVQIKVTGGTGGNGFKIQKVVPKCTSIYSIEDANTNEYPLKYYHFVWLRWDLMLLCSVNFCGSASDLHAAEIDHSSGKITIRSSLALTGYLYNTAVAPRGTHTALQLTDGTVLKYHPDDHTVSPWVTDSGETLSYSPWKLCSQMAVTTMGGEEVVIGLTDRYQLYVNNVEVASNCTSFAVHEDFLLLTTYSHTCRCISRTTEVKVLPTLSDGKTHPYDESTRRVERGSRVVCVVPEDTRVVLQMPRGNLETIHPRALVLAAVRKLLDRLKFKDAFTLMRKHRINLNLLYDHNPQSFLDNVDTFVEEISTPGYISHFFTDLQEEDVTRTMYTAAYAPNRGDTTSDLKVKDKVNKVDTICDRVREVLERVSKDRYLFSILTAYVKKTVPQLDTALKLVKQLKGAPGKGSTSAEDALKHLLFLVDVNELYDVALGTYDFELVLMVAEKSQKDPKEYIPFLNSLRKMEANYQRYTIDKHLKRYVSALTSIVKCGDEYFEECLSLVSEQRLFREALSLYKQDTAQYKAVSVSYAAFLASKQHHEESGVVLARAAQWGGAVSALEAALSWRLALCMAHRAGHTAGNRDEMCRRMAVRLKESSRHSEAACLYEQHLNDVEEAIVTLIEGACWEDALTLMHKSARLDFIDTHLHTALLERQAQQVALLVSMTTDFERHQRRLVVVREERERARLEYLEVDHNRADADLFSDTSSATGESVVSARSQGSQRSQGSGVTASSVFSRRTGRSAKTRRKQERKKWSLKEGSPHEDIALMEALASICTTTQGWKEETSALLRMLVLFCHQRAAEELQTGYEGLLDVVTRAIPEIWPDEDATDNTQLNLGPDSTANAIAEAMRQGRRVTQEVKMDRALRVPPTVTNDNKWKLHSAADFRS